LPYITESVLPAEIIFSKKKKKGKTIILAQDYCNWIISKMHEKYNPIRMSPENPLTADNKLLWEWNVCSEELGRLCDEDWEKSNRSNKTRKSDKKKQDDSNPDRMIRDHSPKVFLHYEFIISRKHHKTIINFVYGEHNPFKLPIPPTSIKLKKKNPTTV
jgi:hypothetical protein